MTLMSPDLPSHQLQLHRNGRDMHLAIHGSSSYVRTIWLAIVWRYIPWNLSQKHGPRIDGRYLQSVLEPDIRKWGKYPRMAMENDDEVLDLGARDPSFKPKSQNWRENLRNNTQHHHTAGYTKVYPKIYIPWPDLSSVQNPSIIPLYWLIYGWIPKIPSRLGRRIPYSHQPTGVLNTAHLAIQTGPWLPHLSAVLHQPVDPLMRLAHLAPFLDARPLGFVTLWLYQE